MTIGIVVAGAAIGCDRAPEPVTAPEPPARRSQATEPATANQEVPQYEDEVAQDPGELPEMVPVDETSLRVGLTRMANCREYDRYVKKAFVSHHISAEFPKEFGRPLKATHRTKLSVGQRNTAVDGEFLYKERRKQVYTVNLVSGAAVGFNDVHYPLPAIQGAQHGWVVRGRTGGLVNGESETFGIGPKSRYMARDKANRRYRPYVSYRRSNSTVYSREGDELRFRRVTQWAGELQRIHVRPESGSAFVFALTEPRLPRDEARRTRGLAKGAADVEELRKRLQSVRLKSNKDARPYYSHLENPRDNKTIKNGWTSCSDVWVPNDDRSVGDQMLAVYRFDTDKYRHQGAWAVAVDDFIAAPGGGLLYVVRRLRGEKRAAEIETPYSEVDVFDMEDDFALRLAARVDGVPAEISCGERGCAFSTTRWPAAETLFYSVTPDGVSESTRKKAHARLGVLTGPAPSWNMWAANLLSDYESVFVLGEHTIAARQEGDGLRFAVFGADGVEVGSTTADVRLLSWDSNKVLLSGKKFLAPVRAIGPNGNDLSAVIGELNGSKVILRWLDIPDEPVALVDDQFVFVTGSSIEWRQLGSKEASRKLMWKDVPVMGDGWPR